MKNNFLLIIVILLLCTAAFAAMKTAPTNPSEEEGAVGATFFGEQETGEQDKKDGSESIGEVDAVITEFLREREYEEALTGKTKVPFDRSSVLFEGSAVPYDEGSETVYLPQSCDTDEWDGILSAPDPEQRICILTEGEKQDYIKEGRSTKLAVVSTDEYMECSLVFSGLPAVCIYNAGTESVGEEDCPGKILVLDPYRKEYQESLCNYHLRGSTSLLFDKKNYRVELCGENGESVKLRFLGLRKDDDWVLNSLGTDESLAREKVCYDLWKKLNETEDFPVPSSEIEYCDLFLDDEYAGVYGLMYPIDRKLMGMNPGDLLYKVFNWYEETEVDGQLTDFNGRSEVINTNGIAYLELKYPKEPADALIWDPFQSYQDMVFVTRDMTEMEERGITLNMENFILHELFCEMTRAGDNTWKNLFIAAYSDGHGGYSLNETIWDLNYTFGDDFKWDPDHGNTYFNAGSTDSYVLRFDRDYGYTTLTHIVDGIREDTGRKWREWRSGGIGPEYVTGLFEKEREFLTGSGAFVRNTKRWPNKEPDAEFPRIENWIEGRFRFLDDMYNYEN